MTTIDDSALHNDVSSLSPSVVSHSRANSEVHGENEDSHWLPFIKNAGSLGVWRRPALTKKEAKLHKN